MSTYERARNSPGACTVGALVRFWMCPCSVLRAWQPKFRWKSNPKNLCFSLQGFEPKQHHQNHQSGLLWHQEPQDSVSLVLCFFLFSQNVSAKTFTFWLDESGCSADVKGIVVFLSSNLIFSVLRFTLMSHTQPQKNMPSACYTMGISVTYISFLFP